MPRAPRIHFSLRKHDVAINLLWSTIADLKTKESVERFFRNLLSDAEVIMVARRIIIAHELLRGQSYDAIIADYHVSRATVAKVQEWLVGRLPKDIKDLKQRETGITQKKKFMRHADAYSFEGLKQRYPAHFLLFNLLSTISKNNKKKM